MKRLLTLGLVLFAAFSNSEVVLKDPAHSASLIFERASSEGKIVETQTWSIGFTSRIVQSTYTDAGVLTERAVSITRARTSTKSEATITPHAALLTTTTRSGTGPSSTIPLNARKNIADPSLLWFVKDQPAKDASVTFMSFDPEFRYWEEITVTFDGRGKLGASVEGNLVTRKTARETIHMLLDDKGLPLVWESGKLRLVRASG